MKVILKNKGQEIELEKDNIIEVLETADGIAINMKDGLSLIYNDQFMPSTAKQLIKGTIDQCMSTTATIIVDLQNHITPARIDANHVTPARTDAP